ncbi:hypothetical protein, partial [Faecalibaculum rodentium]
MKRKDLLMLSASMMGIASGWAVLNDQVYAMTDEENLPEFKEADTSENQIADDSMVLTEEAETFTAVKKQSEEMVSNATSVDSAVYSDQSSSGGQKQPDIQAEAENKSEDTTGLSNGADSGKTEEPDKQASVTGKEEDSSLKTDSPSEP